MTKLQIPLTGSQVVSPIQAGVADTEWQAAESGFLRGCDDAEVSLRYTRDAEFWTLELCVSESELRRAIDAVGPNVAIIRAHLASAI